MSKIKNTFRGKTTDGKIVILEMGS